MTTMADATSTRADLPPPFDASGAGRSDRAPAADPEFGSFYGGPLAGGFDGDPESYLRLVANPFLGFVYLTAWLAVMYETVIVGFAGPLTPMLLAILIAGLWLTPQLIHFHCLDCGGTGRLPRWRKHACPKSLQRSAAGRPRRLRGPSPPLQVILWVWVLMALALFVNALGLYPAPS